MATHRRDGAAATDPAAGTLITRLLDLAVRGLPGMYRADTDDFAFTRAAVGDATELRGVSLRYAAIVALGAHWLPDADQRNVLSGHTATGFTGLLVDRLPAVTNLGD